MKCRHLDAIHISYENAGKKYRKIVYFIRKLGNLSSLILERPLLARQKVNKCVQTFPVWHDM